MKKIALVLALVMLLSSAALAELLGREIPRIAD